MVTPVGFEPTTVAFREHYSGPSELRGRITVCVSTSLNRKSKTVVVCERSSFDYLGDLCYVLFVAVHKLETLQVRFLRRPTTRRTPHQRYTIRHVLFWFIPISSPMFQTVGRSVSMVWGRGIEPLFTAWNA